MCNICEALKRAENGDLSGLEALSEEELATMLVAALEAEQPEEPKAGHILNGHDLSTEEGVTAVLEACMETVLVEGKGLSQEQGQVVLGYATVLEERGMALEAQVNELTSLLMLANVTLELAKERLSVQRG